MFRNASHRQYAAAASIVLAVSLATVSAPSASAEPAPPVSGTTGSTTFTAPDQLASPGTTIAIDTVIKRDDRSTWTDLSGWVNCEGGSWARLSTSPYPDSSYLRAYASLPASDSGKSCTLTLSDRIPGRSISFPSNGISLFYSYLGPTLTIKAQIVVHSTNGGL